MKFRQEMEDIDKQQEPLMRDASGNNLSSNQNEEYSQGSEEGLGIDKDQERLEAERKHQEMIER